MTFTATGTENLMAWDRRARPFMEVWYATVAHRALRAGLWLRYTVKAPQHGDAVCSLWAFYFDPDGKRSFAGRNDYPIDVLGFAPGRDDGAIVRIADAWLSETHLDGVVRHGARTLAWSLDLDPADRCYQHLPPALNALAARRFSTVCSPNLGVPFSGTVELDGEIVRFEGERGAQSHRWGRRHSRSWAWVHCSSWEDGEDAVFEGLGARAASFAPPFTSLYLRYRGEDLTFSHLRSRSYSDFPVWAFAARSDRWKISGAARLRPQRAVQVRYADPDGGARHCVNSEIAEVALQISRRAGEGWRHAGTLTSNGLAHFELGRPERFAELPVVF